jgi:hypothetical protein
MEHKIIFRKYHPRKDFETVKCSCGKKIHTWWWMMDEEIQTHFINGEKCGNSKQQKQ